MKRITFAVGMVVLVFTVSIWAQATGPKPGPEHQKVKMFVGHWTYEVEYKSGPLGPGGKATGVYNAQWILGGFFVQGQWVEKGATGESRGIEIFGYNPATKNYFQSQYMDDGSIGWGEITVSGNTWDYRGLLFMAGKHYKTNGTMTFAADLMSIMVKFEISADDKSWTPLWDAKYTKVLKPAPKK